MAKYESRYLSLGFYVNGEYRQFGGGQYVTDDADEIAVLDAITDVVRADESEAQTEEPAEKPAAKASSRKPSAK